MEHPVSMVIGEPPAQADEPAPLVWLAQLAVLVLPGNKAHKARQDPWAQLV